MSVHPNQKAKKARDSEKSEFLAFLYENDLFSDLAGCLDISWLKVHDAANDLQSRSRNKNGNDGADADRAIQDPANQQNHTDDDGLHQTDGMIWEPLAQGDCQRIARAAALPGRHIKILPEAHHEQPDNNKNNAQTEIAADGNGMEIRNPIDIIAD